MAGRGVAADTPAAPRLPCGGRCESGSLWPGIGVTGSSARLIDDLSSLRAVAGCRRSLADRRSEAANGGQSVRQHGRRRRAAAPAGPGRRSRSGAADRAHAVGSRSGAMDGQSADGSGWLQLPLLFSRPALRPAAPRRPPWHRPHPPVRGEPEPSRPRSWGTPGACSIGQQRSVTVSHGSIEAVPELGGCCSASGSSVTW
jgi:hypothetical protein